MMMTCAICLALTASVMAQDTYPAVTPPIGDGGFGTGIQRTMTLLATSTPEHRNTVRVLFYGQSITEQDWARQVADYLRVTYPDANLIIENRAIGGFAAQMLVKTAEADLYPFYPDLLIFHVYGAHPDYERIIENTRSRTTAEILMQTDHVTVPEDLDEEVDPAKLTPANWSAWMNHSFLPSTAAKYGAELLDQRARWKQYLIENNLAPSDLLVDGVHLSDHGCYLMAELVKEHLRYLPDAPDAAWRDLVTDHSISDADWRDGRLRVEVEGNRIDLIAAPGAKPGLAARVLIDGRPPSEHPGLYTFTRSTCYPGTIWPGVMRAMSESPPLLEDWTARVIEASDDLSAFEFEAEGSETGPDGRGRNTERFVSDSGRVIIEPDDWSIARSREFIGTPIPEGFEMSWSVVPQFVDEYVAPGIGDPAIEEATTVALGLANTRHVVELVVGEDGPPPLAAIRVYRPPYRPDATPE